MAFIINCSTGARSSVLKSCNNVYTFTNNNNREIIVLGGLAYFDFEKFAFIEQARRIELERGSDGKSSLLCYLNLPADKSDQNNNKEILQIEKGEKLQRWNYHEFRGEETATSVKSPEEIIINAENIDPGKNYILGFSCWNRYWYGNHEDNHQLVFIEYSDEGRLKRIPPVINHVLHRFDAVEKKDMEQLELPLPSET